MSDGTVKYLNLQSLLDNKTFRIPDYQRGFSWEEKHFNALWSDLTNLQKGKLKFHYTGMITVELIPEEKWKNWEGDAYFFKQKLASPYYVVDGQQRLTSIFILIHELIEAFFSRDVQNLTLDGMVKAACLGRYILRKDIYGNGDSFVFGYDTDNPSDTHFKTEILGYEAYKEDNPEETAYTKNLSKAKSFFQSRIEEYLEEYGFDELEKLYKLLLGNVRFDFKVLDADLDIFMVFETMNTRGKKLSDLENLKNRLIYLATLFYHIDDENASQKTDNVLRNTIVVGWKNIYKELGKSKRLMDSDDTLLRNHWVMYHGYERQRAKFYADDIFEEVFTVKSVISEDPKSLKRTEIEEYVSSLEQTAQWWFIINNPSHKLAIEKVGNQAILDLLIRINRLKFRFFSPLLFAGLQNEFATIEEKNEFLEAIENYIFLIFTLSYRRSNTGSYHFQALASRLHNKNEYSLANAIYSLDEWTYGGEGYYGYFDFENFRQYLEPLFEQEGKGGYKSWAGMKYFMSEYISQNEILEDWDSYKVVGLYNISQKNREGFNGFDHTKKQKKYLEGSLGNYLFLKEVPADFEKLSFDEIKAFIKNTDPKNDILDYTEWTPAAILKRGKKMLAFLEKRWKTKNATSNESINEERLLYLDTLSIVE